ncbi:Hypothetical protein PAS_chr2-1_0053 [Komagataella phaffii GS115]|uniref:Uncharacterized protein n=1 Tax=Komagataella phaffii (strain GS115 / ATCC 20864) TaxID=644223 RepID=C4QZI0_KOMPG|nr:Hypothetical protein PAS_chr2-1_0053 [Komagataella phaffii GS115]CAY68654.1 Hypothetical protein PAS_chr2-1_0053 [Komagataella phaffii GS115]
MAGIKVGSGTSRNGKYQKQSKIQCIESEDIVLYQPFQTTLYAISKNGWDEILHRHDHWMQDHEVNFVRGNWFRFWEKM